MPRKPYKRNFKLTVTFTEDQDEAMEAFAEAVKIILFQDHPELLPKKHETSSKNGKS